MIEFLSYKNQKNLIAGLVLRKLVVHRDSRGTLMETLRRDWTDVFEEPNCAFGQSYYSVTQPGLARDENYWHLHPTKQSDRFVLLSGNAIVAVYDSRKESKTHKSLNLFIMGEDNGDDNQYILFIPPLILHSFSAVGDKPCGLLNFPTHIYNTAEESRISFSQVGACFPDGASFSWDLVRPAYKG